MRLVLVAETFRSRTPFDIGSHARSLAPALARAGAEVEVFAGTRGSGVPSYCQRRVEVLDHVSSRDGKVATFGVTRIELEGADDPSRIAEAFGAFLDRERPIVCHFEHLNAFGVGLVREAKRRGIATIYAADDTWPAHDRTSLLMPDLTPFELGDSEAEARATAVEALAAEAREADPKFDETAAITDWLHGAMDAPVEAAALRDAREAVEVRRAEKRVALSIVDRRFAASRMLSKELSAAVGRAFTFRAPGVDTALVRAAANDAAPRTGPARFLFCGTSDPACGIDVVLEVARNLRDRDALAPEGDGTASFELTMLLDMTDPERDARVLDRARELRLNVVSIDDAPASSAGPVATAIARCDAVLLPTLWGEVAPALVREALAASKPVIASRMPGVLEAVPQSSGEFVTPGDAEAWTAALADFDREGTVALGARSGGHTPKSIDDEVVEWLDTYGQLVSSRAPISAETVGRAEAIPPHVRGVRDELAQLSELSIAELFARAQEGLGQLKQAFGITESEAEIMRRVVARGGPQRDRAEHDARTRREVAHALSTLNAAQASMRTTEEARARRVAELQSTLESYEQEVRARGDEAAKASEELMSSRELAASLQAELEERTARADALRESVAELEERVAELDARSSEAEGRSADLESERDAAADERDSLRDELRQVELERDRLQEESGTLRENVESVAAQADRARAVLAAVEAERNELADSISARENEIRELREGVRRVAGRITAGDEPTDADASVGEGDDLETLESCTAGLERDLEALRQHDEWVRNEASRLVGRLAYAANREGRVRSAEAASSDALRADLARASVSLDSLVHELEWRRREMRAVRESSGSFRARLFSSPMAVRMRRWQEGPPASASAYAEADDASARPEPRAALPNPNPAQDAGTAAGHANTNDEASAGV